MLSPNQRQHLLQALRPPEEYELSFSIGTTYSLDLMALLFVPLAFAQFDWEDNTGRPSADPLALLEALRRYADRLHVFCQTGCISVSQRQLLFGYLENSVFQVQAPLGGVFHPKVWALRFTAPDKPVLYRLLCLSRNLSFDNSWDTLLVLEGEVVDRQNAFSAHHPLGDFFKALPNLVQSTLPEHVLKNIELAQHELRRVNFIIPDGFNEYGFWPLGINGYARQWPFEGHYDRLLVVSPFLASECLQRLTEKGCNHVLMSRLDSLSALSRQDLAGFKKSFALSPMAEMEEPDIETTQSLLLESAPSGLHAKLYVADDGRKAHIWTGSANATNAAFNKNVEFLIELVGPKSFCGVDVFLEATKERSKFADLWEPFNPNDESEQPDQIQQNMEDVLRAAQSALISGRWSGKVQAAPKVDEFLLQIFPEVNFAIDPGIQLMYWPISLTSISASTYNAEKAPLATFGPLALESLTAFIVFQLTIRIDERMMASQFVLRVPLTGTPEDRQERLLRTMLKDQNQVMRFLLFILADGKNNINNGGTALIDSLNTAATNSPKTNNSETPLFESLVQALHRDPARLDQIARTVADLELTQEGRQLLPQGFQRIWGPIWEARQRLMQ